jgi:hypothetical protein
MTAYLALDGCFLLPDAHQFTLPGVSPFLKILLVILKETTVQPCLSPIESVLHDPVPLYAKPSKDASEKEHFDVHVTALE